MLRPPEHPAQRAGRKGAEALLPSPGNAPRRRFPSARGKAEQARRRGPVAGRCRAARRCPALPWAGPTAPHVAFPQSGLTLLRVGLRIRLTRARVQQLLQLQRQRPRHRHQVSLRAAARQRAAQLSPSPGPGPDGSLPAGALSPGRLLPGTARDRAQPRSSSGPATSGRRAGGGGACVSLRALLGRRRKRAGGCREGRRPRARARARARRGLVWGGAVRERARARGRRWR